MNGKLAIIDLNGDESDLSSDQEEMVLLTGFRRNINLRRTEPYTYDHDGVLVHRRWNAASEPDRRYHSFRHFHLPVAYPVALKPALNGGRSSGIDAGREGGGGRGS
ncbi:hypothetical protein GSI_10519 [Ganoderma sinense ZZ0214-1]|uniref:Uncharacterized protein n=1 Tax=Ganoderma sinense ZZ0214-1 TaxID=1077348 RepID=A0A2G8S0S3_9APHY|nr:hypothetical protein GSI_10519 [Ganoderma sinense ZZ0214-1]